MINQGQTTSFKQELYEGIHDFLTDSIYIALYTGNVMLTQATTVYSSTNEVVGTGYTAGGKELQNATVNAADDTAYISFDNIDWTNATFTARCALIYNASKGNKSIAVLDFGSDKTVVNQTLTITFPANLPDSAIIRSS
jgi:hypothetical protein